MFVLVYGLGIKVCDVGVLLIYVDIGEIIVMYFGIEFGCYGWSFL